MDRTERSTAAVPEVPVRLRVNGRPTPTWTCSPSALEPLGAGRLLALGIARGPDDILSIRILTPESGVQRIEAEVPTERATAGAAERDHRREHGCGLRYLLDCRPDLLAPRDDPYAPDVETYAELFRALFGRSPSRRTTGGHHTTALSDGSRLLHVHEEVGRHNGADKAIGGALLAGDDLPALGLLTTARVSAEIAEKAARARLAWIASRSVPTTLAVEIAGAAGIPIVARAAGKDARVF